jgi:hypothetical protein
MSKFSAIVCDHCDVRDVLETPLVNKIKGYKLTIHPDGAGGTPIKEQKADLCEKCFQQLVEAVFQKMTQIQRMANG